ncbi:MAG: chemotaxis protein CheW [Desulfobacterota bacterium]|nr:chemotaxis protein CheW [Thermodesulfobacteriota bacterium]
MTTISKDEKPQTGTSEKYLTFNLGKEQYGIQILKIKEIIGLMDITKVPRTPEFVRGVINLRGKVIPVIDLRTKFGMEKIDDTEQTCIIVIDIVIDDNPVQMGIIVDSVSEVLDIPQMDIEETPSFGTLVKTEFIKGIAKTKGGVKILLNIEEILTKSEIIKLPHAGESSPEK